MTLCLFACCRELDKFFDNYLGFVSWKFCYIFPVLALIYAYRHKNNIGDNIFSFCASPAFYMMCCAMIVIIPLAQCIGHNPFIADVMGKYRVADIKELFEESCETIGYFIIFLASIETGFNLLSLKKNKNI